MFSFPRSRFVPTASTLLVAGGLALSQPSVDAQPQTDGAAEAPQKELWLQQLEMGLAAQSRGEFRHAMDAYDAARSMAAEAHGPEDLSVAACLQAYGEVAVQLQQFDEADSALAEVQRIREVRLGREHTEVAQALAARAAVARARGDLAGALELLDEGIDIQLAAIGRLHPVYAMLQLRKGAILIEMANYRDAERALVDANRIWELLGDEFRGESAQTTNNLVSLLVMQKRFDEADTMLRLVLRKSQESYGLQSTQVAGTYANIGVVAAAAGNHDTAETALRRALSTYEALYGDEHPLIAQALNNLAEFYRQRGMSGRAISSATRATNMYEKLLGAEHPRTKASREMLDALLAESGATDDGAATDEEAGAEEAAVSPDAGE